MPGSDFTYDDGPYDECARCGAMIRANEASYCDDCQRELDEDNDDVEYEVQS